jgi:hypothetical protein
VVILESKNERERFFYYVIFSFRCIYYVILHARSAKARIFVKLKKRLQPPIKKGAANDRGRFSPAIYYIYNKCRGKSRGYYCPRLQPTEAVERRP